MLKSHLSITQAGLVGLITTIIGQVVAYVPAFAPEKQLLISIASTAVGLGFMLANAVHKLADSNVSTSDVQSGAIAAARDELAKVDFNALVKDAVDSKSLPDLEATVAGEVQRVVSDLFSKAAGAGPAAQAPANITVPTGTSPTGQPPAAA